MSHPFGDLLTQHLHRKHGLSQARLAAGILQSPSIISEMCQGKRLRGAQARERVTAIIGWLQQQGALTTLEEANALLNAVGMAPLQERTTGETHLIRNLTAPANLPQRYLPDTRSTTKAVPVSATRHNLPTQLTPFIGRAQQIAQLLEHLQTNRLLTLTGAGGVGKTRLAIEVATRLRGVFADGVWFVDLAPLTAPEAIPQRILDLWRVPEQPERSALETLIAYLRAKAALLILDNCEHLIVACAELAETLLRQCPQLSLLATSREALNIGGETPWRVPSLTRPHTGPDWEGQRAVVQPAFTPEALARFEAVTLFVERAAVRQSGFALTMANAPAVAQICSRLDGIPLALEMAAARINVFTVEELAARLDGAFDARFQLLTRGARTAPHRQQTLRATLEWSYALLTPEEQRLLAHLSVFSGGWTAAAAEEVTGAPLDRLAQLVNKSLVIADQQAGETRYRLLETVRQFGAEQGKLTEQVHGQAQMQHSHYYLRLLGKQEKRLQGQQQRTGLDIIRADFENISAAWRWAVDQHEFALLAAPVHTLFLYCEVRGNFREGSIMFSSAATELARASAIDTTHGATLQPLWGQVLVRLGACEVKLGNYACGEQHLQDGLSFVSIEQERALALLHLGISEQYRGELALTYTHLQASLVISRGCNDIVGMAYALRSLADRISDYAEACRVCAESLMLWRQLGRPDRIANALNFLAWYLWCTGDYLTASAYWREGMALSEQLDLLGEKAWVLDCLGLAAWGQGDLVTAEQNLQEALAIYTTLGDQTGVGMCQAELSLVLANSGRVEQAMARAQAAIAITRAVNSQMMLTLSLNYLGVVLIAAGDFVAARQALLEAIQRTWEHQYINNLMKAFYNFAELLVRESDAASLPDPLDHKALALTLLSCMCAQRATWQIYKDKAAQLQGEIEEALPADLRATAIARGQTATLEEMVNVLLREAAR